MKNNVIFKELLEMDISFNKLTAVPSMLFENFPKIQNINISYNDIVRFDFLLSHKINGVSLISIDLSKNPAVSWPLVNSRNNNNTLLSNLYELHICYTNLSNLDDVTFDSFLSLQHLYLKFNKIRRLSISPFSKLNFLENLDVSYNKITHVKTSNFRGLVKLNALCLSNNYIESIETFTEDLSNLKLLDLSHNRLQNILNQDLVNLKELTVLYLSFNNIKYISVTAFNNLNKIIHIDLEHNKLQTIPVDLFTIIESHIQEISIKDNIIMCSCQRNNTWTWIQDHPKIIDSSAVTCINDEYPKEKCDFPTITQLSIDKHKDNSVSVSWFIRNRTAVKSLQIMYYDDDITTDVIYRYLDKSETSTLISDLIPSKNYIVCILTLDLNPFTKLIDEEISEVNVSLSDFKFTSNISRSYAATLISQSPSSECVTFDTFTKHSIKMKPNKTFHLSSILNRRMGLIVGCALGFVVFFVMVSVLLYTKIKERKRIAKSDPAWSEMNDYHSIQSKEDVLQSTTASTDNILLGMAKNRKMSLEQLK
ncbi:PREDICTED: leucine-rich repeats and immunoglobulin-like domains protein 2 [Papilio xuthus]|uniref:Leucine-rich repeats and immunoglobulin-like domains protein 2 n=1 Tax=Papilio xuthus TaxID=66420 RepID=A0AAJ6ZDN4_PAPXU|nr:PREDICTED: leucine-rich repeats and immunoglobulin-like domains protein 2 [Papilio xuthus]